MLSVSVLIHLIFKNLFTQDQILYKSSKLGVKVCVKV